MSKILKNSTKYGFVWSTIERFSMQGVQLLTTIILARLIEPSEFGILGMIAVFIALAQTFVDSGLGASLIQYNNPSQEDFKTVFTLNLLLSLLVYLILYFTAPLISEFYNQPSLINIIRICSLMFFFNALSIVPRSIMIMNLRFKKLTSINLISSILSGIIAIIFAFNGFEVWALVILFISKSLITALLFLVMSTISFQIGINILSFKKLFGFGYKMLLSSLFSALMNNISEVLVGKYYNPAQLGFFAKAKQLSNLSSGTISSIIDQVVFPVFSKLKNNPSEEKKFYLKIVNLTSFISIPALALLAILAKPTVIFLFGEKWLEMSVLVTLMSISRIFRPIKSVNMNYVKSIGRSDLFLKMEIFQAPLVLLAVFSSISFGVTALTASLIITDFTFFLVSMYFPYKFLSINVLDQFKCLFKPMIGTVTMTIVLLLFLPYIDLILLKLIFGVLIGVISYIICMMFLRDEMITYFLKLLKLDKINEKLM